MAWLRVQFFVDNDWSQRVSDALEAVGAIAVIIQSANDDACYDSDYGERPAWQKVCVTGLFPGDYFPDLIIDAVATVLGCQPSRYRVNRVEDQDWEQVSLDSFQPIMVGHHLWICPSWSQPPQREHVNIILDPGLAFGTGTHPTTALCLDWLSRNELQRLKVVDYGCGSGILAIAALKLGASCACGVDIDPRALTVSEDNAERNGVRSQFRAALPHELTEEVKADIVIANILANTLATLAPRLCTLVRTGGRLLLSGILEDQGDMVSCHYRPQFALERFRRDNWLLIVGTKR